MSAVEKAGQYSRRGDAPRALPAARTSVHGVPDAQASGLRLVVELAADGLPDELVEAVAQRAAEILAERLDTTGGSPYVTVVEAAAYLRCSRQRIYDLLAARRLTRLKDGARTLLLRDELDAWLRGASVGDAPPSDLAKARDARRFGR